MKNTVSLISYCVTAVALVIVYLVLNGRRFPLAGSDRAAFYLLWVVGLSMSILAGTRDMTDGKMIIPSLILYPLMILGAISFLLPLVMLIGGRLSWLSNYRAAFILLAVMIGVKWLLVHGWLVAKFFSGSGGIST